MTSSDTYLDHIDRHVTTDLQARTGAGTGESPEINEESVDQPWVCK
jgi:hypothetical protein